MSSVDDRIVNMQFNNKQFQTGVTQSQASLDSLEKSLAKTGNSKGMAALDQQVGSTAKGFGALQVAGVAAIATIASKATAAGLGFVKSFTIAPLMQGFQEYQTNLNSIQTIIANTGKSVGVVNKYLNELNEYSDQTVYNFSQMADSIGKFTAAGVPLKQATSAIKGMANTAALSGANVMQLNSAMYQVSQALAAGTIKLMDWNSIVNANMGGKNIQNALTATAKSVGINVDGMIKKYGSFRDSLQSGWLSAEVFNKAMKVMAGTTDEVTGKTKAFTVEQLKSMGYTQKQAAELNKLSQASIDAATQIKTLPQLLDVVGESIGSAWSKVFTVVLGDFEQSKALWTSVGTVITDQIGTWATSFEHLLQGWADLGGRDTLIKAFGNLFSSLIKIAGAVSDAFRDVFPATTSKNLVDMTNSFERFTAMLVPSESTLKSLRSIFGGLFSVLHVGVSVLGAISSGFKAMFGALFDGSAGARGGLLGILAALGETLISVDDWITQGGKLNDILEKIGGTAGTVLKPLVVGIGLVVQAFASLATGGGIDGFMEPFNDAKGAFADFASKVVGALAAATAPFDKLSGVLENLKQKIDAVKNSFDDLSIGDKVSSGTDKIASSFDKVAGVTDSAEGSVKKLFGTLSGSEATAAEAKTSAMSTAAEGSSAAFDRVGSVLSALGNAIKATFTALGNAASWVKSQFSQLFGGMDALDWASLLNAAFSGALILTIKKFMDTFRDMLGGLADIGPSVKGTFDQLTDSLAAMQHAVMAKAILSIAIAVGVLTAALIALAFIGPEKIAISLGAISAMMAILVGSMKAMSGIGKTVGADGEEIQSGSLSLMGLAAAMVLMSAAMINLAIAVSILGQQDPKKVATGIAAMAVMMGIMVGSMSYLAKMEGPMIAAAGAIFIIASAMTVMAAAVLAFGSMDMETLAKGIGSIAIMMAILVKSMDAFSSGGKRMLAGAAAIAIMAGAITLLAGAVGLMGRMDLGTLVQGIAAMAIVLVLMVGALMAMSGVSGQVVLAASGMLLMAMALQKLTLVILALGVVPFEIVAKGIGAVALALGVLLLAGLAAMYVAPGLLVLGVTIGLLGAAMLMAGVGMLAFGTGFALMAAAGVAGTAILVAGFTAFMALLPTFAIQVAAAFVTFVETIAKAAPRLRSAFGTIFKELVGVIQDAIPVIGDLFQELLNTGIRIIEETIPRYVEMGFTIIDEFLNSAEDHVPKIADSALKLITKFVTTIGNNLGPLMDAAAKLIVKFVQGLADAIENNTDALRNAGLDLAMAIINGMTGGLLGKGIGLVKSAAESLANAIPGPIKKVLDINSPSKVAMRLGFGVGEGLALGIKKSTTLAVTAVIAMANKTIAAGSAAVAKAQDKFSRDQTRADKAQATADASKTASKRLEKSNPKLSKALAKQAEKQQKQADKLQARADKSAERVSDAIAFRDADNEGRGDIKSQDAIDLADKARQKLAEANAEAAQAKKLRKTNRKAADALLAESKRDAAAAKAYAKQAQAADKAADRYYAAAVNERIKALESERKQRAKEEADEKKFNAASTKDKAAIMAKRAADSQAQATKAAKDAATYIARAKQWAGKDADKAQAYLDLAIAKDEEAQAAADRAAQEKDEAAKLAQQAIDEAKTGGGPTPGAPGSPGFQVSRSVLEEAAKAMDRYTESLEFAQEQAAAAPGVVQFNQNNYSPEALSPTEVYRQTKNLLTTQEVKIGAVV